VPAALERPSRLSNLDEDSIRVSARSRSMTTNAWF
jgi:hypothetical protein